MYETLTMLPMSFWAAFLLLVGGGFWAIRHLQDGTGLPLLAVLGTVAAWYVGDVFYNDYPNNHAKLFDAATLQGAWWQVAWFIIVLLVATPLLHQQINRHFLARKSGVLQLFKHGIDHRGIQHQLSILFWGCAGAWTLLAVLALLILQQNIIYYLFPFLGYKANPWSHGQIGSGFDCFSIIAVYIQLLTASMFGVVAALTTNRRIRYCAIGFCLLAWPFFIFDRTRNTMLAMAIPAVLSWVFLRFRGGIWKKAVVLLACFCVVNFWMKFVIANRSTTSITAAFKDKGLTLSSEEKVHNEGLNMFEELCWISTFIDDGTYHVNWGQRYFAELVNPIPRGLWPGKPLIGLDYAIARGHHADKTGAVDTTISTGMIGQGVVNFGRFFGPMAAAILMSLWIAFLARLDLNIHALGRLPMYSLGLILTFNLGRDITLITLYPFVFGTMGLWLWEKYHPQVNVLTPLRHSVPATPAASMRKQNTAAPRPGFARRLSGGFVKRTPNTNSAIKPNLSK